MHAEKKMSTISIATVINVKQVFFSLASQEYDIVVRVILRNKKTTTTNNNKNNNNSNKMIHFIGLHQHIPVNISCFTRNADSHKATFFLLVYYPNSYQHLSHQYERTEENRPIWLLYLLVWVFWTILNKNYQLNGILMAHTVSGIHKRIILLCLLLVLFLLLL